MSELHRVVRVRRYAAFLVQCASLRASGVVGAKSVRPSMLPMKILMARLNDSKSIYFSFLTSGRCHYCRRPAYSSGEIVARDSRRTLWLQKIPMRVAHGAFLHP